MGRAPIPGTRVHQPERCLLSVGAVLGTPHLRSVNPYPICPLCPGLGTLEAGSVKVGVLHLSSSLFEFLP